MTAAPTASTRVGYGLGSGEAYLVATVLFWGTGFPAAKPLLAVMDPWLFSFLRCGLALLLLSAVLRLQGIALRVPRRELPGLVGLGLFGVTWFQGMWSLGLAHTTASAAALIMATSPVWGSLIAHFGGERLRAANWCGVLLSFAGVFLIINNSVAGLTISGTGALGNLIFVGNAFTFAAYTAASRPVIARHGALKAMVWVLLFGTAGLLLFSLPGLARQDWAPLQRPLFLNLIFVGLGASGIAQVTWYAALGRLGLARTVIAMFLVPAIALLTSVTLLGDTMSVIQGAGATMALAGVALSRWR